MNNINNMNNNNNNIPWLEKYRPKKIKDIVSQDEITNILNNIVLTKEMPHLLFYGSPGIGKTTAVLALCRELYGIEKFYDNVLELNASDERGINVVRNKIITFARLKIGTADPNYPCPPFKIIILDEAEAMTKDAQSALRKVMEEYTDIARFCFICNNIHQIIEPINSRCMKLKFKTIPIININNKLMEIALMENINIKMDDLKAISEISNGDLRKSILFLQNLKYLKDKQPTYDAIYNLNKYISYTQMSNYIDKIIQNKDISNLLKITNDIINQGYVFYSILKQFIDYVLNLNIDNIKKAKILYNLSNVEKIINNSGDEYSQLLKILNDVRMAFI